ncbi:MAG: shikimate kinase [Pirellulaceae bacterium]
MNLYLIGYRGVGKSTVARLLAERLQRTFLDADVELERRAGRTIADIFAADGEGVFRELESDVIADLARRHDLVVALGGGAVMREQNRAALAGGRIVWLTADAETILARVTSDATTTERRPNLTTSGGLDEIVQLLAVRDPVYRQCAALTVDTEGKSPGQVVDEIVASLARE